MPINIQPGDGFMRRMLGASNAVAQNMGGPMGDAARITSSFGNRMRPGVMPSRAIVPNTGMMPPGGTGMGMSGGADMPIVQGPQMSPSMSGGYTRNPGIAGGMFRDGLPRFQPPMMNTGNMSNPSSSFHSPLWTSYAHQMGRPMSFGFGRG